jgi:hypothetical protein
MTAFVGIIVAARVLIYIFLVYLNLNLCNSYSVH